MDRQPMSPEDQASGAERRALADYPRIATCPSCGDYLRSYWSQVPTPALVAATLAHHATAHSRGLLVLASQHFA
jgi:hypothetical protein